MSKKRRAVHSISVEELAPGESAKWSGRKVKQVTDDEIVDVVATAGMTGIDTIDPFEGSPTQWLMESLDLDAYDDAEEQRLFGRIHGMKRRLVVDDHHRLRLTPTEWGKRLEGKTATQIAKALRGSEEDL